MLQLFLRVKEITKNFVLITAIENTHLTAMKRKLRLKLLS